MTASPQKRIIIIGAGVTGLSLAQGLKKANIPFVIYEKNEDRQTRRSWSFAIHWGMEALQELLPPDLFDLIPTTQTQPHSRGIGQVPIVDGATGKVLKDIDSDKMFRLTRHRLRELLLTGLDEFVHWNKELAGVSYSDDDATATVSFADGSQASGSMVVGCDGAHSIIRQLLVGQQQTRLIPVGDVATDLCFTKHTAEHALSLRPFKVGLHPKGMYAYVCIQDAEDESRPETWTFMSYISYHASQGQENWSRQQRMQHAKALAQDFCEPWKSMYSWMSDDEPQVWHTRMQHWDPSLPEHAWDNHDGRITLAGDAAHPMTFQRGQACNHAMYDASMLFRQIQKWASGEASRQQAVDDYEKEMIERAGKEVRLSAETSRLAHEPGKVLESPIFTQGTKRSVQE